MTIRRAEVRDIPALQELLRQVLYVHHQARPDLFEAEGSKYTETELEELIQDDQRPIFIYEDCEGRVLGHLFTMIQESKAPSVVHKTLFIDDLCVDQETRGQKIGEQLYRFAIDYAKRIGCYALTLNVWNDNLGALRFYQNQGMTPRETCMEQILGED